jgi:hypothetical protein
MRVTDAAGGNLANMMAEYAIDFAMGLDKPLVDEHEIHIRPLFSSLGVLYIEIWEKLSGRPDHARLNWFVSPGMIPFNKEMEAISSPR